MYSRAQNVPLPPLALNHRRREMQIWEEARRQLFFFFSSAERKRERGGGGGGRKGEKKKSWLEMNVGPPTPFPPLGAVQWNSDNRDSFVGDKPKSRCAAQLRMDP